MGLFNFNNLPVNTLVGADYATFRAVSDGSEIDKQYRRKFKTTRLLCRLLNPFCRINDRRYEKLSIQAGNKDPVFIIGHWRSGTTFVHNVFSQDERFGYCSTYQTVFPHLMLWGTPFFKWCMKTFMPSQRPTDSMELGVDLPQEEEFALANMMPYAHYNFWSFPRRMAEYREKYLLFNDLTEQERQVFKQALDKMIRIALHTQHKKLFLSKNPPHTGRIRTLLEMYPNAKFVYLVRNPYTVFESTRNFFRKTMESIQLQRISDQELTQEILMNYRTLYEKYEQEKHLIPEGHLLEVRFEDFESDPLKMTETIYSKLQLGGFEQARPAMEKYLEAHRNFRKNEYFYDIETLRLVEKNWGEALRQWKYKP